MWSSLFRVIHRSIRQLLTSAFAPERHILAAVTYSMNELLRAYFLLVRRGEGTADARHVGFSHGAAAGQVWEDVVALLLDAAHGRCEKAQLYYRHSPVHP